MVRRRISNSHNSIAMVPNTLSTPTPPLTTTNSSSNSNSSPTINGGRPHSSSTPTPSTIVFNPYITSPHDPNAPYNALPLPSSLSSSSSSSQQEATTGSSSTSSTTVPNNNTVESPSEKLERENRLQKAREISDEIDRGLEKERREKGLSANVGPGPGSGGSGGGVGGKGAKLVGGGAGKKEDVAKEVRVLLLGPSESGKSTFLKQLRLLYDPKSLNQERHSYRLVILLTLVQAVRAMLEVLERMSIGQGSQGQGGSQQGGSGSGHHQQASRSGSKGRGENDLVGGREGAKSPTNNIGGGGSGTTSMGPGSGGEAAQCLLRRMRLSPVLELEEPLRQSLGVLSGIPSSSTSASALSLSSRANYSAVAQSGSFSEHLWQPPVAPLTSSATKLSIPPQNQNQNQNQNGLGSGGSAGSCGGSRTTTATAATLSSEESSSLAAFEDSDEDDFSFDFKNTSGANGVAHSNGNGSTTNGKISLPLRPTTSTSGDSSTRTKLNKRRRKVQQPSTGIKFDGPDTYVIPSRWRDPTTALNMIPPMRRTKSFGYLKKINSAFVKGSSASVANSPNPPSAFHLNGTSGGGGAGNESSGDESRAGGSSGGGVDDDEDDPAEVIASSLDEIRSLWETVVRRGGVSNLGSKGQQQQQSKSSSSTSSSSAAAFEFSESTRYFLDHLDRVAQPGYMPTDEDLVNTRVKTIGVEEHLIRIDNKQSLRAVDVAGARGQRHVWASFFSDADAMIFILAIDTYNQRLPEDLSVNRLQDALELFGSVCGNKLLSKVTTILFLNKVDLLRRKLRTGMYPVKDYFPEYTGIDKIEPVLTYFKDQFKHLATTVAPKDKRLYVHYTTANDIRLARMTIGSINDTILRKNLEFAGII